MDDEASVIDPDGSAIETVPHSAIAVLTRSAQARQAEDDAAHSPDPWARTEAAKSRWLSSKTNLGTRSAYERAFNSLMALGEEFGVAPIAMGRSDIDRWCEAIQTYGNLATKNPSPLSPTSATRYLATASSFYKYCIRWPCTAPDHRKDGADCGAPWVTSNPVPDGDARPPVNGVSPQQHLEADQVRGFLSAARKHGTRARALAALLAQALRISEALGADITDLRLEKGHQVLKVTGKRSKTRLVVIPAAAFRDIEPAIAGRTAGPIITTSRGTPFDRHAAWDLVQELATTAGLPTPIGPHTFRHAAITQALFRKVPLADVQDWAGHSDSRTTRRYDRAAGHVDRSPAHTVVLDYFLGGDE